MPRLIPILLALFLAVPMCAANENVEGVPGEIISEGMRPFSETWEQMVQRDRARLARIAQGLEPAPPPVRAHPRMDFPPLGPEGHAPGQEEAAPPPVEGPTQPAIDTSFAGITLQDQFSAFGWGSIPPDTMGAAGPDHFMVVINSSVAIHNKTGTRLSHVSLDTFFTVTVGGKTYPRGGSFDPRVLYDARSGRWFAIALERGASPSDQENHIVLAVSRTANPTGVWDRYVIPVGVPKQGAINYFSDFDTLGTDDNGVYFAVRIFPSAGQTYAKIAATGKASLIAAAPSLGTVTQWSNIQDMYSTPQPAHNTDGSGSNRAWFVSADPSFYANIRYRTLTWSGGVPTLSGTSTLSTPAFAAPIDAPASGSTTNVDVGDMRLAMAVIRDNRLWTCRNVGVNSSGGSSGANRTGCEWLELNVTGVTATLVQSGRVHDTAAGNPRFYYYPSIMVNSLGAAVMGFSGSSATEFIGAYCCGRLAGDTAGTMGAVTTLRAGQASYTSLDNINRNRWGDYSYTSLDPDGVDIWTIQEYATNIGANIWGTWIARLSLGYVPPANDNCGSATVLSGLDGAIAQSTLGATKGGGEPTPTCVSGIFNTVWFSITPSRNGWAVLSTSGAAFDTVMAVYRGTCGGMMTQVACSDDAIGAAGSGYSAPAFPVEAGVTYYVQAGGRHDYSAGTLHLRYSLGPECMSIARVKQAPVASRVTICNKIVQSTPAANGVGMTFVEEPDRTMGIAVSSDFGSLAVGTGITLVGYMGVTPDGNLFILPGTMAGVGSDTARGPVGMTNRAVGGSAFFSQRGVNGGTGPNNIGLYVNTWGRVTGVDAGSNTYWIDDGSDLSYQPGHTGLAVLYQGSPPSVGDYVRVTGFPWLWDPFETPILVEVSRM